MPKKKSPARKKAAKKAAAGRAYSVKVGGYKRRPPRKGRK